ncbi:hypothetical protein P9112_009800 [Eukaryota sp. TZLM1-RC]
MTSIAAEQQSFPDGPILSPYEAEQIVKSLKEFALDQVASSPWMSQRSSIEKLNLQAHQSAQANQDEFVVDLLLSYDAITILIKELLTLDVWISNVFSSSSSTTLLSSPKTYFVLFHACTLANLLEIAFYNKETVVSADPMLLDLVSFAIDKLSFLLTCQPLKVLESSGKEELIEKYKRIQFSVCINLGFILRFIVDRREELPLSVPNFLLSKVDFPCLLVQLLEHRPWLIIDRSKKLRMTWNGTTFVEDSDPNIIHKFEAAIFISLWNLLSSSFISEKYEITHQRRETLLRINSLIKPIYLDQLPILNELKSIVDQISIMQPNSSQSSLFIVSEEPLFMETLKNHQSLINQSIKNIDSYFGPEAMNDLLDVANLYSNPSVTEILEKPRCSDCGLEAKFRCSVCKLEWYCDRVCQKRSWKRHKIYCKRS